MKRSEIWGMHRERLHRCGLKRTHFPDPTTVAHDCALLQSLMPLHSIRATLLQSFPRKPESGLILLSSIVARMKRSEIRGMHRERLHRCGLKRTHFPDPTAAAHDRALLRSRIPLRSIRATFPFGAASPPL